MVLSVDSGIRSQGWCPKCRLKSVVASGTSLVCTSPQCDWEADRTEVISQMLRSGRERLHFHQSASRQTWKRQAWRGVSSRVPLD